MVVNAQGVMMGWAVADTHIGTPEFLARLSTSVPPGGGDPHAHLSTRHWYACPRKARVRLPRARSR
jgi:hypothetical protein